MGKEQQASLAKSKDEPEAGNELADEPFELPK